MFARSEGAHLVQTIGCTPSVCHLELTPQKPCQILRIHNSHNRARRVLRFQKRLQHGVTTWSTVNFCRCGIFFVAYGQEYAIQCGPANNNLLLTLGEARILLLGQSSAEFLTSSYSLETALNGWGNFCCLRFPCFSAGRDPVRYKNSQRCLLATCILLVNVTTEQNFLLPHREDPPPTVSYLLSETRTSYQ